MLFDLPAECSACGLIPKFFLSNSFSYQNKFKSAIFQLYLQQYAFISSVHFPNPRFVMLSSILRVTSTTDLDIDYDLPLGG
jgi:hypothetical protein